MDRRRREEAPAERRALPGPVPHRLPDERCARPGAQTVAEPGPVRQRQDRDRGDARRQIRRAQEPGGSRRTAGHGPRRARGHGSQGPALPVMATQGTPPGRSRAGPSDKPGPVWNDGSSGPHTAASPRSSNHAERPADARTTSSGPSDSATPTPGPRHSTTRSRSPSTWPTSSATSTISSP